MRLNGQQAIINSCHLIKASLFASSGMEISLCTAYLSNLFRRRYQNLRQVSSQMRTTSFCVRILYPTVMKPEKKKMFILLHNAFFNKHTRPHSHQYSFQFYCVHFSFHLRSRHDVFISHNSLIPTQGYSMLNSRVLNTP